MKLTIPNPQSILDSVKESNLRLQSQTLILSQDSAQPIHTVYGGAQLFSHETIQKLSQSALKVFDEVTQDPFSLSEVGLDFAERGLLDRVRNKIKTRAVEDYRIDFEDGFGHRPDAEEDHHAERAALEVAKALEMGTLPPFIGIRIKSFSEETKARSLRTLDIFLTTLLAQTQRTLPPGFVITLPKVTHPEQASSFVKALTAFENSSGLKPNSLQMEFMVETSQTLFNHDGIFQLPLILRACQGRARGAHFGTYDFTASCHITAKYQAMDHPSCDFARHLMKAAYDGSGIWLSDGATNVMPVGDRRTILAAWKLAISHTRTSLRNGLYQGWDLHPAQLPARFLAVFSFFMEGMDSTILRLKNFMDKAAQATLVGDVFDDAATGQGLLNTFLKGLQCGAMTEAEVLRSGLTIEELNTRSFKAILEMRKRKKPH